RGRPPDRDDRGAAGARRGRQPAAGDAPEPGLKPAFPARPASGDNGGRPVTSTGLLHPLVAAWFRRRFDTPTAVQERGWAASAAERQAHARRPPHIWITTPESLFILLASDGGRRALATVRTVILDEIHAVAATKRGSHLALSVERLEQLAGRPLQRIGLSATV